MKKEKENEGTEEGDTHTPIHI